MDENCLKEGAEELAFAVHLNGIRYSIHSWSGLRDACGHIDGCGTAYMADGSTLQCRVEHGVVTGAYLLTCSNGGVSAGVSSSRGDLHGTFIWKDIDGRAYVDIFKNGLCVQSRTGNVNR